MGAVTTLKELVHVRRDLKNAGKKVVFTNGCFDILHRGHVEYLANAKALGDVLMVGVNSDASVKRIKGEGRPIIEADDRMRVLAALASVDYVCMFDEDTPQNVIEQLVPDILVKGADWPLEKVVGKDVVEAAGGSVKTIEFLPHRSTTRIIEKISRATPVQR
ncbi:MAG: D-glycero-beta-D-manno-heptose 1-phosphate adenylyltransferase [Ignavibacteriales bacterium]|nr:D-glycero-beta-D-manno-heptose 1-phosphate adenylyltransferase [Ignavibacteriales bacterium]